MIVGTAGHVDHGKTALVRALTGVDTDRLPEERRRGITIALGFAPLVLPGVGTVGVVDVPGHEAFVRTMLAGATGIDVALLVIAADEGAMPQTREHLDILRLLGVPRAVVALTKADLVEQDLLELVTLDVSELLAASPFRDASILPVSAVTGAGVDALRSALTDALSMLPARIGGDLFRLPVDRAFTVAGAGTVVTGTAWSGRIQVGDTLRIVPGGPTARVRGLESHGVAAKQSEPGARLAVALAGLDRDRIHPGQCLVCASDPWFESRVIKADVTLLDEAPPLGVRTKLRFHLGTLECGARVIVRDGPLRPGRPYPARVVLDALVVARSGDRFVIRGGATHTTLGGGVITDPFPLTPRAKPWPAANAEPRERLQWMLHEAGAAGVDLTSLPIRLGLRPVELERLLKSVKGTARVGSRLVESAMLDTMRTQLIELIARAHRETPLSPGLDRQTARAALTPNDVLADEVIRRSERAGLLEVAGSALRLPGWDPNVAAGAGETRGKLLEALEEAGAEPPSVAELQAELGNDVPALLRLLERDGSAVTVSPDRWYAASALRALLATLRAGTDPTRRYTPSELRELLGISRKYLIPFLEWCDRRGISRRADEGRLFPAVPENP